MNYYYAVIECDSTNQHAHGAWFPDLQGCFSAADAQEDILSNCVEAVNLWAEDQPMPAPSTIYSLMMMDDVKADIARGCFLMAVPYIVPHHKPTRINISMDKGIIDAIDTTAKQQNMTRSAFLADCALRHITNLKNV